MGVLVVDRFHYFKLGNRRYIKNLYGFCAPNCGFKVEWLAKLQ